MGISRQIFGSFEDIGKDIVHETVQVPKDIAGAALESLGASSGKKTTNTGQTQTSQTGNQKSPLSQLEQTSDEAIKKSIARAALAQLAGQKQEAEPSIWDQKLREDAQKKQIEEQKKKEALGALPAIKGKPKRGNLYGVKQKASSEMSKNVRQD